MGERQHHTTELEAWLNLSGWGYLAAGILGILIVLLMERQSIGGAFNEISEYMAFYAGARLAGTSYLYDAEHVRQEQIEATGTYGPAVKFVRLPFYAAMISPLGRLPYRVSFRLWQGLSLCALLAFLFFWHIPNRRLTALACSWSLPLAMAFVFAQDITVLLLLLALAFRFHKESPIVTGLVMCLFAIKFNLFLLLPLLLIAQRRWNMALGFLLGSAILLGTSFAVAGHDWPAKMFAVISSKEILPREYVMPNLRGLLQPITNRLLPEIILDVLIGAVVFMVVRRSDFEYGMAAAITGSLLVSHHAVPSDCALLIPALLIVVSRAVGPVMNYLCLILLMPLPYLLLTYGGLSAWISKASFVALLFVMALESVE